MHSFIVSEIDIPINPDVLVINSDTSIGITEVRTIQAFLSRKPINSPGNTVIINEADKLTLPAQNALLKTLEEPPPNSVIYLVTDAPDKLIDTILSRVQINIHTSNSSAINTILIEEVLDKSVSERIILLNEKISTREDLSDLLVQLETHIHKTLNQNKINTLAEYKTLVKTRKYIISNCNLKATITYFATHLTNNYKNDSL